MSYLFDTHNRSPLSFKSGKGVYLKGHNGIKYLDFISGIAVVSLGYSNRLVNKALRKQSKKVWHVSNIYSIPEAESLAKLITEKTFADKVFFSNSGAEAVECLIKVMRRHSVLKYNNNDRNRIITFKGSFHGRTIATISASGNKPYTDTFGPLTDGFDIVEYGNLESVKSAITKNTAGILVETIQGEGGVNFAGFDFIKELRKICDTNNLTLGIDEIQCGLGRTGKIFAFEHANIKPDIVAIAKGLGNGFPIAATVATNELASAITPGKHGTTFGSNPLAMVVGETVFKIISDDKLLQHVNDMSKTLHKITQRIASDFPNIIQEVKGYGLMLGLKINPEVSTADNIVEIARRHGLLLIPAGGNVIRILPSLILKIKHIHEMEKKLRLTLKEIDIIGISH